MITSKTKLHEYLEQDARACKHRGTRPKIIGDEIWKFQYSFRQLNYQLNRPDKNVLTKAQLIYWRVKDHHYSIKLGFTISCRADIGKGFSIAHCGSIVISGSAVIGDN